MKKLSLLFAAVLAFAMNAMALNPYAYAVSVAEAGDNATISYTLNAAATAVSVVAYKDGVELPAAVLTGCDATAGAHTAVVDLSTLTEAGTYTFGVKVEATSPEAPTKETTTYQFWSPYGIAIDKDPASPYFGRLLITEAQGNVPASYSTGIDKSGIYVFTPEFTPVMDGDKWACYKGGLNLTSKMGSSSTNAYSPIRIRISEDGRIFASMQDFTKAAVYEISQDLQTWTPVISGTDNGDGTLVDAEGNFVAGLNCSMDVKGSGENLKILLYSCNLAGTGFAQSGYRLDEYALGTATTFTGTPTHIAAFDGNYGLVSAHCAVYYDRAEEGAYWFTANRGGNSGEPNLVHFAADGTRDYYSESADYYGGAGLAQYDGKLYMGGNSGFIQAYTSTVVEGTRTVTASGTQITTGIGRNVNAIEFDYAGNMYACSNSGEKLAAFAMPYSGAVTTPVVNYEVEVEAAAETLAEVYVEFMADESLTSSDASNTYTTATDSTTVFSQGADKVIITAVANVYKGRQNTGAKFSSGKQNGTITLQLVNPIADAQAIIVESAGYGDAEYATFTVNGTTVAHTASKAANKHFVFDTIPVTGALSEVTITATSATAAGTSATDRRFYLKSVRILYTASSDPEPEDNVSPYCQTEVGHLFLETPDQNSYVLLSIGSNNGKTVVRVDQDTEKNSAMFDYLLVNPMGATTGADVETGGANFIAVEFDTPTPDAEGYITLEILWSTVNWPGRWMVQNVKVKADATCEHAVLGGDTPTGFENIETEKAFKFYHNGQIFIQKGDAVYTITGVRVQ